MTKLRPRRRNSWVGLPGTTSGRFANPLITRAFRESRSPRPESFFRNQFVFGFPQPLGTCVKSVVCVRRHGCLWVPDAGRRAARGFDSGPDRWTAGTIFPPPYGRRRSDSHPSCQLYPQISPKTQKSRPCGNSCAESRLLVYNVASGEREGRI